MTVIPIAQAQSNGGSRGISADALSVIRDTANTVLQVGSDAAKTVKQGTDIVARFDEMQRAIIEMNDNLNEIKPIVIGSSIVIAVALSILAYKAFK